MWVSAVIYHPRFYLLPYPTLFYPFFSLLPCKEKTNNSLHWTAMPSGVSPSALSSISRYFPGPSQFPPLRGILELAAKKIHYSLCDTNKYKVSTCIFFKVPYMFLCLAYGFCMITHAGTRGSQAFSFILVPPEIITLPCLSPLSSPNDAHFIWAGAEGCLPTS